MKKFFITLLVLVILAGLFIGAYVLFWTPENFAKLGESKMNEGDYEAAADRYEIAVELAPNNHDYVMSLVKAYTMQKNYTKAERTLVNAIKSNPTAALYCTLSQLYVEQDKILDSQLMLDTITSEAVRAEVEALRPASPTFSHESGSYDSYIEVSIQTSSGTIYYSVNADYPSSHSDPYSSPIALSAGKTNIQAITVGDNGLVSPIVTANYDIVGLVEDLTFESPELEAMLRDQLYIPRTVSIKTSDIWDIESLKLPVEVTTLEDLKHFPALTSLDLQGCNIESYAALTYAPTLEVLNMTGNLVSSETLGYIGQLESLKELYLSGCGISGITSLSNLTALEILELADNSIQDISTLSKMPNLIKLDLRSNAITSLNALTGMSTLQYFDISYNSISTLAPLQQCMHMQVLRAEHNNLLSVGALGHMADLSVLDVSDNELEDISALSNCTRMTELRVNNNFLTSVDCIGKMPLLTYLDCSYNQITALPEINTMSHLQQFYASYNQLASVAPLAGLTELTYVNVDYNETIEDIEVLSSCRLLVQVNAFGTHVREVKLLTDYGVIVNFDPSFADQEIADQETED